jgi:Flp pilus assembly protein TadG
MDDPRKNKSHCGIAVVETVFMLPLLIILTFGGIKYGWLFMRHQQLTNAARQCARVAIRPNDRTADISNMFNALMTKANITGAQVTADPDGGNADVNEDVTVTVTIDPVSASNVDILKIPFLPAPSKMTAQVVMSKESL